MRTRIGAQALTGASSAPATARPSAGRADRQTRKWSARLTQGVSDSLTQETSDVVFFRDALVETVPSSRTPSAVPAAAASPASVRGPRGSPGASDLHGHQHQRVRPWLA